MDDLIVTNRPTTGVGSQEYGQAFATALRRKHPAGVQNALSVGRRDAGGYLVPDEFDQKIIKALESENVMRKIARVIRTESGERRIPVVDLEGEAAWVDENEELPESDDKFGQISLNSYKAGTLIKVSEELLHDSVFDLEAHIADSFAKRIGRLEEEAFINGDGKGKPTGFLRDAQTVKTEGTAMTTDDMIDLIHSLDRSYRKKAVFLANDNTIRELRKLRDAEGQYIWQPSLTEGEPDLFLGYRFYASQNMPDIAPGAKAVAFGDFSFYWIADREGRIIQRLDELYAIYGQVGFKLTSRVDGKLVLPEAVKVLVIKE